MLKEMQVQGNISQAISTLYSTPGAMSQVAYVLAQIKHSPLQIRGVDMSKL